MATINEKKKPAKLKDKSLKNVNDSVTEVHDAIAVLKISVTKNFTKIVNNAKKKKQLSAELVSIANDLRNIHFLVAGVHLHEGRRPGGTNIKTGQSGKLPPAVVTALTKIHRTIANFKRNMTKRSGTFIMGLEGPRKKFTRIVIALISDIDSIHRLVIDKPLRAVKESISDVAVFEDHEAEFDAMLNEDEIEGYDDDFDEDFDDREFEVEGEFEDDFVDLDDFDDNEFEVDSDFDEFNDDNFDGGFEFDDEDLTEATAQLAVFEDLNVERREDERVSPLGGGGSLPRHKARKHIADLLKVSSRFSVREDDDGAFLREFASLVGWVDAVYHDVGQYRNVRNSYTRSLKRKK